MPATVQRQTVRIEFQDRDAQTFRDVLDVRPTPDGRWLEILSNPHRYLIPEREIKYLEMQGTET